MILKEWHNMAFMTGRDYYPVGNGRITGVLQIDHGGFYAPVTLIIQSPENFSNKKFMKESTYLFDAEQGCEDTALVASVDGRKFKAMHSNMHAGWKDGKSAAIAEACWWAGPLRIRETLFASATGPVIYRAVNMKNEGEYECEAAILASFLPNTTIFGKSSVSDEIPAASASGETESMGICMLPNKTEGVSCLTETDENGVTALRFKHTCLKPGREFEGVFVYTLAGDMGELADIHRRLAAVDIKKEARYAEDRRMSGTVIECEDKGLKHLFDCAVRGLMVCAGETGRVNAGMWKYNAEWVRDSSLTALADLHAGLIDDAKRIFKRIISGLIDDCGRTIVASSFPSEEYEQFDQAGEFLYALGQYYLWTGDSKFIVDNWKKIEAVSDRLCNSICRDRENGMYRNIREYWERNDNYGVEEGYELAYQMWPVLGLRSAGMLAEATGSEENIRKAEYWKKQGDKIWDAATSHPVYSLIVNGRLIKRKKTNGDIQSEMTPKHKFPSDIPLGNDRISLLNPDTSCVLPIIYGLMDKDGEIARNTLQDMEKLWNLRWDIGGYDRYHTSSEPDTPGAWGLASLFVARANHLCGRTDRSLRAVKWFGNIQGGASGSWHEYIPTVRTYAESATMVGWGAWAELVFFFVREVLGISPFGETVSINPRLFSEMGKVYAKFPIRDIIVELELDANNPPCDRARVNGGEWISLLATGHRITLRA